MGLQSLMPYLELEICVDEYSFMNRDSLQAGLLQEIGNYIYFYT